MKKQAILISQPDFKELLGLSEAKYHQAKRNGLLPPVIKVGGVIPYFNNAECMAFLVGDWTADRQKEWRRTHQQAMLGKVPHNMDDAEADLYLASRGGEAA